MSIEHRRSPKRVTARAFAALVPFVVLLLFSTGQVSAAGTMYEPVPHARTASDSLSIGSTGAPVVQLQKRLAALGYRPGAVDGNFGAGTASAVLAFQKREGLQRTSVVGPRVQTALLHPSGAGPRHGLPTPRVEVDIARQIAFVVLPNRPVVMLNVSTGSGQPYRAPNGVRDVADTPVGSFSVVWKFDGNRVAPLGTLHRPLYFYRGWAIHGSNSVPAYPASHGCVRVSNTDADWLFPIVAVGTPVILYDTTGKSPHVGQLPTRAAPGI
jgi:peptidoglycan hydrolase-like protein with peptidoglycan-binding domain